MKKQLTKGNLSLVCKNLNLKALLCIGITSFVMLCSILFDLYHIRFCN